MAEKSKISWTDHTFNPWMGCTKVSPGCKNCYAETLMDERYGKVKWGPIGPRIRTSAQTWNKVRKWNRGEWIECASCHWRGEWTEQKEGACPSCKSLDIKSARQRVFVASLADVCEEHLTIKSEWHQDLANLVKECTNLDFLFLTKRPENFNNIYLHVFDGKLPENLWVGTSVENQESANKRIPALLDIPARVRFLSCEPLLDVVDLFNVECGEDYFNALKDDGQRSLFGMALSGKIDWVIAGGESGSGARPVNIDWARLLRDECKQFNVPFHFKQWGEWIPAGQKSNGGGELAPGTKYHSFVGSISARIGKHKAGRLLDGIEWNEFPK